MKIVVQGIATLKKINNYQLLLYYKVASEKNNPHE